MLHVTHFSLQGEYTLFVEFNDGYKGLLDLKDKLENDHRPIIRDLLNPSLFNTAKLDHDTICWDNEVDFAPEFLYDCLKKSELERAA